MKLLAIALCGIGLFVSPLLFAQGKAAWYPDPAAAFPDRDYLAFLGEGVDASAATMDAMDKLSRYFGVDVSTVSDGSERYAESGEGANALSSLERSVSNHVTSSSKHRLYNVELTPALQVKDKRWAMVASIRRADGLATWNQLEDNALQQLQYSLELMENENAGMGSRMVAQKAVALLMQRIIQFETKRRLLQSDAPAKLDPKLNDRYASIREKLLPRLAIKIKADNPDAAELVDLAAAQLSGAGMLTGESGEIQLEINLDLAEGSSAYGLKSLGWHLKLAMTDAKSRIFSQSLSGKAGGSDAAAARQKAVRAAGEALNKQFIPALIDRLGAALD